MTGVSPSEYGRVGFSIIASSEYKHISGIEEAFSKYGANIDYLEQAAKRIMPVIAGLQLSGKDNNRLNELTEELYNIREAQTAVRNNSSIKPGDLLNQAYDRSRNEFSLNTVRTQLYEAIGNQMDLGTLIAMRERGELDLHITMEEGNREYKFVLTDQQGKVLAAQANMENITAKKIEATGNGIDVRVVDETYKPAKK